MNAFESTFAAALEAEVQETAMSVDATRAEEKLEARLDNADRSRRRRYWAVGAAAAAAVVVAIVVVVTSQSSDQGGRPLPAQTPSPSTAPATAQPYSSATFLVPFTAELPPWTKGVVPDINPSARFQTWQMNQCQDCAPGTEVKLRMIIPDSVYEPGAKGNPVAMPDYEGYLAYLSSLEAAGSLSLTNRGTTTVGGKPATVFSVKVDKAVPDGQACEDIHAKPGECFGFDPKIAARLAVIKVGPGAPLLMWTRAFPDNPERATYEAQFDQMLATVTFTATPSP